MNSNYDKRGTSSVALQGGVVVALTLQAVATFGQLAIAPITIPSAASLGVSSLNSTGQVAGYYFTQASEQRAFFWSAGTGTDLDSLGGVTVAANSLNNFGTVVGYSSLPGEAEYRAFLHTGAGMLDLGSLGGPVSSATGINDAGQVTGYSYVSPFSLDYRAFRWSEGVLHDLGTLGGSFSAGAAINSLGQVVGDSTLPGNWVNHGFLYSGGVMRDLGSLGGSSSSAFALNELGQVAGQSTTLFDLETHATFFDGTTLRDLGTLGGSFSAAYRINDLGQLIGDSLLAGDVEYRGFIFEGGTMQSLGTLGGGYSSAWALNNLGQVVGVSSNGIGQQRAFLWQNGVMSDLNALLPPDSGWELTGAYFINDVGHIVGDGFYQGLYHWYLFGPATDENHPPMANAGADVAAECDAGYATVHLNGHASSDPDGDILTYEWFEGSVLLVAGAAPTVSFPSGIHTLTLRVTDSRDASAEDSVVVSVVDNTAPVVFCGTGKSAPANAAGLAAIPDVVQSLVASDSCTAAASLVRTQNPVVGTLVGVGDHEITVTVADTAGHETSCGIRFTVTDVTAPAVECPEAVTAPANSQGVALVTDFLASLVATDNSTAASALVKTQSPVAGTPVGLGTHTVVIAVADAAGNLTTCSATFSVADVTSPVVEAPAEITRVVLANCQAAVPDLSLLIVATDNCTPAHDLVVVQEPLAGTLLEVGAYELRLTVTDTSGNSTTRVVLMNVADQTPPVIHYVMATPNVLAPANRKMVPVMISVAATDNCDASPICHIESVTSSEPILSASDSTSPDWYITGDLTLQLRAEVDATDTRTYLILISTTDASGNVAYRTVEVRVFKNKKVNETLFNGSAKKKKK